MLLLLGFSMAQVDSTRGFAGATACAPVTSADSSQPRLMALVMWQGAAPGESERLNHLDCQAPLALFRQPGGGLEIWAAGENAPAAQLLITVTHDEMQAKILKAIRSGEDTIIAGPVAGTTLIARADGSLRAEQSDVYRFDFFSSGSHNTGYGIHLAAG